MKLYIDTNIFLSVIYKEEPSAKSSGELLRAVHVGRFVGVTSSVTLLEMILDMSASNFVDHVDSAVTAVEDLLDIVPLDKVMCKRAANYVLKDRLTIHDAYHLATALSSEAEVFVTRDEPLSRKLRKYLQVRKPDELQA